MYNKEKKKNILQYFFILSIASLIMYELKPAIETSTDEWDYTGQPAKDIYGVNVPVQTGDITLDLSELIKFTTPHCESKDITTSCGSGSTCNITVGPCTVETSTGKAKLNAAPSGIVFSRYLEANKHDVSSLTELNEDTMFTSVPLRLTKETNYTQIINFFVPGIADVSYLVMLLPTDSGMVNKIKNLPIAVKRYLAIQAERDVESVLVIYRSKNPESSVWEEPILTSEMRIPFSEVAKNTKKYISRIEIGNDGSLRITYEGLRRANGTIIPETRITYPINQ